MREIIFRGKCILEGRTTWTYGDLLHTYGKVYIHPKANMFRADGNLSKLMVTHEVLPETVGQYTGFTDKNGKKIFEDDILCEPDVMHNGQIQIPGEIARVVMDEGCYFVSYEGYAQFLSNVCNKWDVIGNIHDNPELIGCVGDG